MHFPELSPYTYGLRMPLMDVLNVGWLDRSMPFPKGVVPALVMDRLKGWFEVGRVNLMRGIHECNLCRAEQWPPLPLRDHPWITIGTRTVLLGHWEIWIPGRDGKVFASPALVIHYIDTHQYCPPKEYIDAVLSDDKRNSWNAEVEYALRCRS